MPTTRRQSMSHPAEGKAEAIDESNSPQTTVQRRRTSTITRQPRVKARGMKAAEEVETERQEPTAEKELKDEQEAEAETKMGDKRAVECGPTTSGTDGEAEHPKKKGRGGSRGQRRKEVGVVYKEGTIERGHIYFFYRPKVQMEEVESLEDVRNTSMLLIPRPPEWATSVEAAAQETQEGTAGKAEPAEPEMKVLSPGADVVPSPELLGATNKHYRLITVGKKHLPTEEVMEGTTSRKRPVFWATVTAVGNDLESLERGLGEKTYETATRGTRYDAPARLAARGVYAIVNKEAPHVPSKRESHFAYCISHPSAESFRDVQHELGILPAAAFVLQIKNPLAPPMGPRQARTTTKGKYPPELMRTVFGTGTGGKGRHDYGLRFASLKEGVEGVEETIGKERGKALVEAEEKEENESIEKIYAELGFDMEKFPAEPLKGEWI